ncbi:MAG: Ig-like domain-containing protein [Bacilli bacterium]|nr:Ig-like domain-containing protein [Bacilli bacterium]
MKLINKKQYNSVIYVCFCISVGLLIFWLTYAVTNSLNKNEEAVDETVEIKDVTKVVFNEEVTALYVGDSTKLTPTIYPTSMKDKKLKWESSNSNIAKVSDDGTVKAINPGVTTITVETENGVNSSYYLIVNKKNDVVLVDKVTLNVDEFTLLPDTTVQLIAKITPVDATNQVLLWKSSNTNVATVTNEGYVKAVGVGTAIISVVSHRGKYASAVIHVKSNEVSVPQVEVLSAKDLFNKNSLNGITMAQTAVFSQGEVVSTYSYNTNDTVLFPISSASKSILGIVAAKMNDDGILNLDTKIDTYWHRVNGYDYTTCSSEWQKAIGSKDTFKKYTASNVELVENHASLRNCLTHSSTVKNMSMVHLRPNDDSSEYFGGGMGKNYGVAAFMLSHTYHQLFEKGGVPGSTTAYNYLKDSLTREHALAGYTMQISMKESVNEYLKREILNPLGCTSNGGFTNGNSIYFSTYYQSSAVDLAKIISMVANDGVSNGKRILNISAINNIEKVESKLKNQTIAFDYVDGKYIKFGNYSSISGASNYKLSDVSNKYATYITYDPNKNIGFVVNVKFDSKNNKNNAYNLFNNMNGYFYS